MGGRGSSWSISSAAKRAVLRAREGRRGAAWALANLVFAVYRLMKGYYHAARSRCLNVFCDVLYRWGGKLGVSGNYIGRMLGRANRTVILSREDLYLYLSQEKPDGNFYPSAPQRSSRSQSIINILGPLITKEDRFLEIGCNMGRNLNHLWHAGYCNLRGVEFCEHFVTRLREVYPALAGVPVDVGPAEVVIRGFPDRAFDVVFTMSVLEEVHPESRVLFREIARVARRYVLAIEPRQGKASHYQYPWDIRGEFLTAGLSVVDVRPWSTVWEGALVADNEWADSMKDYDAFLFSVGAAPARGIEVAQPGVSR